MSSLFGGNKEKEQNKQLHEQAGIEAAQAALQMGLGHGSQAAGIAATTAQQGLMHGGMQHVAGAPAPSSSGMSGAQLPGSAMGSTLGAHQSTQMYCPPGQQCPPTQQCTHMPPQQQYSQQFQPAHMSGAPAGQMPVMQPMPAGGMPVMQQSTHMPAGGMMHMDAKAQEKALKEQEKEMKEREKMMEKEVKEREKHMKEEQKQHEKEMKQHEKEMAREQKEHEKEMKEREKQREKEEKEREKEMKDMTNYQASNLSQPHTDAFNPLVGKSASGQSAAAAPMAGTSKPSTAQGTSHFSLLPSGTLNTTGH